MVSSSYFTSDTYFSRVFIVNENDFYKYTSKYEDINVYKNKINEYFVEIPLLSLSTRIENDYFFSKWGII